jgi:ABC-type antimicrobial peptide transport system permease subunit
MDLDLSRGRIEISEGRKPKDAFDVIVNEIHKDDMEIGKTINTKVAGNKLKVVGYYTSDFVDDDTYYVNADTITKHYTSKQKSISVYAADIPLLKYVLDKVGIPSSINDERDKIIYINVHKNQLISAIIVAAVIVLISLIEMFLMLRASFLSRIKEVGTMRAIGLKKKDIYRMFIGEILVITFITAVPGIAIMYFLLSRVVSVTYYLEGMYVLSPLVAAITMGIILVFNLIAGLIPVFTTMRRTPAQILARTDI